MKEGRRTLGLSQARLAEKAGSSTQYIAMIELSRKFPSPEMLERIAGALGIDTPQLFSIPSSPAGVLQKFRQTVLADLEKNVGKAVLKAVSETVSRVIADHLKDTD
jgi:transcriptional regulator with XRE-family HTH domain